MRKRLPIPLILLTPIVLLVVVVIAGVYRFSLSDEEIMHKFHAPVASNPIVAQLFQLQTPNPWTISVPDTHAFAFIDKYDSEKSMATGGYDDGQVRGKVTVDTRFLTPIDKHAFAGVMSISNQGTGLFYYLATFTFDSQRQRLVVADTQFIGDRVIIEDVMVNEKIIAVESLQRDEDQPMSEAPQRSETILFSVNQRFSLKKQD
ncbi:hypothetical protein [Vibrio sonorensis]|uniref:hypothetical protein n=1 Tax=Vibrio sonorensis TaxID=1004316 RepID=UPI0008DA40EA|nr:hypothetical protein [Vibrio sonorensis]